MQIICLQNQLKKHAPGLWHHKIHPIKFSLVVDNFVIDYTKKEDAEYLIKAIKENFEVVAEDTNVNLFCGISLKWNYKDRTVDIKMTDYIEKVLPKFKHAKLTKSVNHPHKHIESTHASKTQFSGNPDNSPKLKKMKSHNSCK